MKSARILVFSPVILLVGYGVSVTVRAWGQPPATETSAPPLAADLLPAQKAGQHSALGVRHESDPAMDKLLQEEAAAERQVVKLIDAYSRAERDTDRSKIKSDLATALEKEFELQQKRRELELDRVEARLKKVRELMKKRSDARQSIIDKRLDQLIREAEGLGWTPPAGISLTQPSLRTSPLNGYPPRFMEGTGKK
jgi:hypothetical protein